MLRRRLRKKGMVVFLLGMGVVFYLCLRWFLSEGGQTIASGLGRRLGMTVRVGGWEGLPWGPLIVKNVTLTQNDNAPPMVWMERLELSFRPGSFLRRQLESLRISGLVVHFRRSKGEPFDFEKVLRNLGPSGKPSPWTLRDIEVTFDRFLLDDQESGVRLRLENVHFQSHPAKALRFGEARSFSLESSGGVLFFGEARQSLDRLALRGYVSSQRWVLHALQVHQGGSRLEGKGVVELAPSMRLDVRGSVSVRLSDVRSLNPSLLRQAEGVLTLSDFVLAGKLENPSIRAHLVLEGFRQPTFQLERVTAQLTGNLQTLFIAPIQTEILGGRVQASAALKGKEEVHLHADVHGLNLKTLRETYFPSVPEGWEGVVNGSLTAALRGTTFRVYGVWTPNRLSWQGKPLAAGDLRYTLENNAFRLEGVLAGVTFKATGNINPLNLRWVARGEEVAEVASLVGLPLAGSLSAEATVLGTLENPSVDFSLQLEKGKIGGRYPLPSLEVRGEWKASRLFLSEARWHSGEGSLRIRGEISPQLDVQVQADRFDMAPYVRAGVRGVPVEGWIDGTLTVRGTPTSLLLSGELRPQNVRLSDVPLEVEPIPVYTEEGHFLFPRLSVSVGRARFSGRASFDRERYTFRFGTEAPVSLDALRTSLPERLAQQLADWRGTIEFQAWGDALLKMPSASWTLSLDEGRYRDVVLGRSVVDVLLDEQNLRGRGVLLDRAFDVEWDVHLADASLPMRGRLSCLKADLLPFLRIFGWPAGKGIRSAFLTGNLEVSGELACSETLRGMFVLDTVQLNTDHYTLENVQPVRGSVTLSGVQIERLAMSSSRPEHPFDLLVEGLLDGNRPLDFNVDAQVFDLSLVADLLGMPEQFRGRGTYRLRLRGTARQPEFETDWQINDAAIELVSERPPILLRDIVGRVSYRDKALRIERIAFRLGQEPIVVTGEIPLNLSFVLIPLVDRIGETPMNLTIRGCNGDLSWLRALDSRFLELDGKTHLDIHVAGTVDKPLVEGIVSLDISNALLEPMKRPFRDVSVRLRLDTVGEAKGRLLRARLEGGGFLSSAWTTWEGSMTLPVPENYLSKGLRLEELQGDIAARLEGNVLSSLVEAIGGRSLPLEVALSGEARWRFYGTRPQEGNGTFTFNRLVLSGNGQTLSNRFPVTMRLEKNRLHVGNFVLEGDTGQLDVRGFVSLPTEAMGGALAVSARAEEIPLSLVGGFFAPTSLGGKLDVSLDVTGTWEMPRFEAEWHVYEAHLDRVAVDSFRGGVQYDGHTLFLRGWELFSYGNRLAVEGDVPLELGWKKNAPLVRISESSMRVDFRGEGMRLDFLPLVWSGVLEASGRVDVEGTLTDSVKKPYLRGGARIVEGRFRLAGSDTEIRDLGVILHADGNALRTENFRFRVGEATYAIPEALLTMEGLRPVRGRCAFEFGGASLESWWKPPAELATEFSGRGFFDFDFSAMASAGISEGTPWERILRRGSYVEGTVLFDSVRVTWGNNHLTAREGAVVRLHRGVLEVGALRDGATLRPVTVQNAAEDPTRLFSFDVKGVWDLERTLDVSVAGHVGAQWLNELLLDRMPRPEGMPTPTFSGEFRFDGRLSGSVKSPRFSLLMGAENLQVNAVAIQRLSASFVYAEETLRIEQARFLVGDNEVRVRGEIPFILDLFGGRFEVLDREFELLVDSELHNFDFLPALFPTVIGRAEGTGTLRLTMGGRLSTPLYRGSAEVRNLLVDAPVNRLLLSETNGSLRLEGESLRLEAPIMGRLNDGTFRITEATIQLEKGLPTFADVRGTLHGVTFYEPGEYRVKTDATLRVAGPLEHLRVSGEVFPSEIRYEHDWKKFVRDNLSSEAQMRRRAQFNVPLLRGMELDLSVQAGRNLVVDTGVGELEAQVDGRVLGLVAAPIFVGEISISKGTFSYLGNSFRIESGQITNKDAGRFDPEYTVVASTVEPLRSVRLLDEQGQVQVRDAHVRATLRGRLGQAQPPEFAVTVLNRAQGEEFSLTTQQGISLLTFGDATLANVDVATESLLEEGVQSYLGGRFARALGLRSLDVEVSQSDLEASRFSLTKELSSQWILSYASTFQLDQEQRIEVEYRVNRNLSIIGERNEQGKYGVDLKFEYEFR